MDNTLNCKETTGLFLVDACRNVGVHICDSCEKMVCKDHIFHNIVGKTNQQLCLSCKAIKDPRLTSQIELYSPDRMIWRKKMMNRFHTEYPFMASMVNNYDALFAALLISDFADHSNDSSAFDS